MKTQEVFKNACVRGVFLVLRNFKWMMVQRTLRMIRWACCFIVPVTFLFSYGRNLLMNITDTEIQLVIVILVCSVVLQLLWNTSKYARDFSAAIIVGYADDIATQISMAMCPSAISIPHD